MRSYTLICENGVYAIHRTGFRQVGVMGSGVGGTDRKQAIKDAKKFCKQSIAKLVIEC